MIGLIVLGGAIYVGTKLTRDGAKEAKRTFFSEKPSFTAPPTKEEVEEIRNRREEEFHLTEEEMELLTNHRMKKAVMEEVFRRGDTFR